MASRPRQIGTSHTTGNCTEDIRSCECNCIVIQQAGIPPPKAPKDKVHAISFSFTLSSICLAILTSMHFFTTSLLSQLIAYPVTRASTLDSDGDSTRTAK